MKQQIVATLRKTHTLAAVERCRYVAHRVNGARSNRTFATSHPDDPMPPPWITYDAFSTIDYPKYWETGKARAEFIADRAREHLVSPGPVYDWGCGPGRVARHLTSRRDVFSEVLASDYNVATIDCEIDSNLATPGQDYRQWVRLTDGLRVYVLPSPDIIHVT